MLSENEMEKGEGYKTDERRTFSVSPRSATIRAMRVSRVDLALF
jgi:hypothetical protein